MEILGTIINNYRIDRLLGERSTGAVYRAYHLSAQKNVAIKLLRRELTSQPEFRERFTQAAGVMSEMDHPGIVRVLDFGQHREQLYIVMELIPGPTLRQLLDGLI